MPIVEADDYVCDLDLFRAGWHAGFIAATDGAGLAPSADEMFFRLFPDGQPSRSLISEKLGLSLTDNT